MIDGNVGNITSAAKAQASGMLIAGNANQLTNATTEKNIEEILRILNKQNFDLDETLRPPFLQKTIIKEMIEAITGKALTELKELDSSALTQLITTLKHKVNGQDNDLTPKQRAGVIVAMLHSDLPLTISADLLKGIHLNDVGTIIATVVDSPPFKANVKRLISELVYELSVDATIYAVVHEILQNLRDQDHATELKQLSNLVKKLNKDLKRKVLTQFIESNTPLTNALPLFLDDETNGEVKGMIQFLLNDLVFRKNACENLLNVINAIPNLKREQQGHAIKKITEIFQKGDYTKLSGEEKTSVQKALESKIMMMMEKHTPLIITSDLLKSVPEKNVLEIIKYCIRTQPLKLEQRKAAIEEIRTIIELPDFTTLLGVEKDGITKALGAEQAPAPEQQTSKQSRIGALVVRTGRGVLRKTATLPTIYEVKCATAELAAIGATDAADARPSIGGRTWYGGVQRAETVNDPAETAFEGVGKKRPDPVQAGGYRSKLDGEWKQATPQGAPLSKPLLQKSHTVGGVGNGSGPRR